MPIETTVTYAVQAFYADGRKGVYATAGDEAFIRREADRLVVECGYARAEIETWELCAACRGNGRVSKRRGKRLVPFAYVECKVCGGRGSWQVTS